MSFFVIIYRETILKKIVGTAEISLDKVSNSAGNLIASAAIGDIKEASKHSTELSKTLLAWNTWTNFYKWIITTGVALLGAFAVFAGTILCS